MEYYANYNYIVTELCVNRDKPFLECNGKCYLAKEIKKVNNGNHDNKSNLPKINFKDFPVTSISIINYSFASSLNNKRLKIQKEDNCIPLEIYKTVLKPPKIA